MPYFFRQKLIIDNLNNEVADNFISNNDIFEIK